MTVEWDGYELFSVHEALGAIAKYGEEEWSAGDLLRAAVTNRVRLLCKADEIGVAGFVSEWQEGVPAGVGGSEEGELFPECTVYVTTVERTYSGYFDPMSHDSGVVYLKSLMREKEAEQGITDFVSNDNDCLHVWGDNGYRPLITDFYITGLQLSLLITNLIQRNQYRYVTIFVAAELMTLTESEKWGRLRSRFGSVHSEYHTSKITQAAKQGAFPVWKRKLNGHWACEWGKDVYSTQMVLVNDIKQHFGVELALENRSLTPEALNSVLVDTFALDKMFKDNGAVPPTPAQMVGMRKIYRFIVEKVSADFDFSSFDMTKVGNLAGFTTQDMLEEISPIGGCDPSLDTFRRHYLQKASFLFKKIAKNPN